MTERNWAFAPRTIAGAIFAIAMLLSATGSQAASITPDSVNPWQHIVDCWGAMLHDSSTHQASCSPGQAGTNTTLVTPVPGGGSGVPHVTCPVGLGRSVFPTYQVASLDETIGAPSAASHGNKIYFADCGTSCGTCTDGAQRDVVLFDAIRRVASLDERLDSPAESDAAHGTLIACCPVGQ